METQRALVIGESEDWRTRVCASLALTSLSVDAFASGREALGRLEGAVLVVVADRASDVSGVALCRHIRELPGGEAIATIVVSSLSDELDRVLAFENGADDFVPEPFSARELAARARALQRRRQQRASSPRAAELEAGPLRIDAFTGDAELNGRRLRLTARELDVLKQLAVSGGRVVRRSELLHALSGDGHLSERLVDTHVKAIRRKLGDARDLIETVRGVGYRFDSTVEASPRR